MRKNWFARAVAGLTGRIETIVVLIPRSDRRSPVDAEEYHDRPFRRRPIGPAKQGQTNLLRRLQEQCPSRPSAQQSLLSGELDTPTGILVADRLSWDGQGAGEQRVFQVASKGLIDLRWWRRELQRKGQARWKLREARVMLIRGWERKLRKAERRWHDGV